MTYTIKINNDETLQAKSLIQFLRSLSETQEYSFLKIEQEPEDEFSEELIEELDLRLEHFNKYGDTYKDWEDIINKYKKK